MKEKNLSVCQLALIAGTRVALGAGIGLLLSQKLDDGKVIDETSDYFQATIWVTLGTHRFTLYSLLYRTDGSNQVRPILRSYGTL